METTMMGYIGLQYRVIYYEMSELKWLEDL